MQQWGRRQRLQLAPIRSARIRARRLWPVRGVGSRPAPVLVVPNDHLAVQLLLLLFESILHLLPLQTTIPGERKAACKDEASCPPCTTATAPCCPEPRHPCRNKGPPRPFIRVSSETGPGLWNPAFLPQNSLLLGARTHHSCSRYRHCLNLPSSFKFFLLQHSSSS